MSKQTKASKRREITMPPCGYQPSRAELREEYDMSGVDMETIREAFFKSGRDPRARSETEGFISASSPSLKFGGNCQART